MPVIESTRIRQDLAGAKWMRCDLHAHTPFDCSRTFGVDASGARAKAAAGDSAGLTAIADQLFNACSTACEGEPLDLVVLTDHNSIEGYGLLSHLLDELTQSRAEAGERVPTFLPGLEVTIGTERPLHINLVFPKSTELREIEGLLAHLFQTNPRFNPSGTEPRSCMLPISEFFDRLTSYCRPVDRSRNIPFLAIPSGDLDAGVWNGLKGHLRAKGVTHPDWHAFFTSEEFSKLNQGFKDLIAEWGVSRFEKKWEEMGREEKRRVLSQRHWPLVEGSDPTHWDHFGRKYSWLKMESPDLEGIRIALLDAESRLRRQAHGCPADGHPQITRVTVRGTDFIEDVTIPFNPGLNTLIGGRGSGKSTVLELLRLALDRGREADFSPAEELSRKAFDRLVTGKAERDFGGAPGIILPETRVSVELCVHGTKYEVEWKPRASVAVALDGSDAPVDVRQLIAPRFMSQQQIAEIASDPVAQRRELDALLRQTELQAILGRIEEAKQGISRGQAARRALAAKVEKLPALRTELKQVLDQLALVQSDKNVTVLARFERLVGEQSWAKAQREALVEGAEGARKLARDLVERAEKIQKPEQVESQEFVDSLALKVEEAFRRAAALVGEAMTALDSGKADVNALGTEWSKSFKPAKEAYDTVMAQLKEAGVDPKQHEALLGRKGRLLADIKLSEQAQVELAQNEVALASALAELADASHARFELRKSFADSIGGEGSDDLRITLVAFGDQTVLRGAKDQFFGGTSFHEDDWDALCEYVFVQAPNVPDGLREVVRAIRADIVSTKSGNAFAAADKTSLAAVVSSLRKNYVSALQRIGDEMLDRLETFVPDDTVETSVRDAAGDFRPIEQGSLGQKATGILALLLAGGTEPLVIDQPEENLDNSYIYRVVVSLLRDRKLKRQLIFATHNANIPVNGDAENIVALHVVNRLAAVKCAGSIDVVAVKEAVGEIMEGSSEAFRLRKLRYGF